MKKLSFAAVALVALFAPVAANAQAQGQINASATIGQVLAFDNTSAEPISFGTLTPDQTTNPVAAGYIPLKHNVAVQIWFTGLPNLSDGTFGTCPAAQGDVTATSSQFYQATTGGVMTNYVHVRATLSATEVNAATPGLYEGTVEVRAAKSTI